MNEHPSYVVFEHLPIFFESRKLTPGNPDDLADKSTQADEKQVYDRARFITELNQIGYFRADAHDQAGRLVVVLILALRGKFTTSGPNLRTLIGALDSENLAKRGALAEVIVIAPEGTLAKKNMTDIIAEFKVASSSGAEFYNMYPYPIFSLDLPRAQSVPHHEIVPAKEAAEILRRGYLSLQDLKTMHVSDPPVVWIGGRPDQIVRTTSSSRTSGEALDYWRLIP